MSVATPNNTSVNPIWRSRMTDWSSVRVKPRMLYSPVCASASVGGVMRGSERFLNEAKKSGSWMWSGEADMDREAWPTGGAATGPHGYYRNQATSVSSPVQSVRHLY